MFDCVEQYDIPENWALIPFDMSTIKISTNKKKVKQQEYLSKGIPVIDQGQALIGGYINRQECLIEEAPPLIVFGDHTKIVKYLSFSFAPGADGVKVLKNHEFFLPKLYFYFLQVLAKDIPNKGYSRHFQFLSKKFVPLPPLNEQKRIVAKIEELFSELDNAVENLKKVQQQLKVYRQAVLKAAFEGKLIEANNQIAEWEIKPLGELIEEPRYGTSKKCSYHDVGIGVLRIPNLLDYILDDSDLKKTDLTDDEKETYELREGDLLIIRSNGSISLVGKTSIVSRKETQYAFAGYLIRLRCNELINPKFLLYCLSSYGLRMQIESKAKSTSGVNNINAKEIKSLMIPICSLNEQEKVVEAIESRLSLCDEIEKIIEQNLLLEQSLRQSILKKAFEGKLVTQDLNDESACMLLERMKAEKDLSYQQVSKAKKSNNKKEIVTV